MVGNVIVRLVPTYDYGAIFNSESDFISVGRESSAIGAWQRDVDEYL